MREQSPPAVRKERIHRANLEAPRETGDYVLYWMIAQRRTGWNFALQHAVVRARELGKPLLIFEALRADYRWASDRLHTFVIEGMADNAAACAEAGVTYYPYVEPRIGEGRGLLRALAARAACVVTDEFPCFFLPHMVRAAASQLDVQLETVDGNGLVPLRATPGAFPTAYAFRRWLQRELPQYLTDMPVPNPLAALAEHPQASVPREVSQRWPALAADELRTPADWLGSLPIDHSVGKAAMQGGATAGERLVKSFVGHKLARYDDERNQPEHDVTSGLSPYLHFGHVSSHRVVHEVLRREGWSPSSLASTASGSREGWWGVGESAEGFLDQIVTWRELGYVFTFHRPDDYDRYTGLPDWAQRTLGEHADDAREFVYSYDEFETAATHDELWNAAQRQLVREGRMHNYLRMLWGKKVLEWSETPQRALATLIELNNKFAVDGRNPNSYSGICWTLGRFDRAWGPERAVYGKIRYMSSANTARKVRVKDYVAKYGDD